MSDGSIVLPIVEQPTVSVSATPITTSPAPDLVDDAYTITAPEGVSLDDSTGLWTQIKASLKEAGVTKAAADKITKTYFDVGSKVQLQAKEKHAAEMSQFGPGLVAIQQEMVNWANANLAPDTQEFVKSQINNAVGLKALQSLKAGFIKPAATAPASSSVGTGVESMQKQMNELIHAQMKGDSTKENKDRQSQLAREIAKARMQRGDYPNMTA